MLPRQYKIYAFAQLVQVQFVYVIRLAKLCFCVLILFRCFRTIRLGFTLVVADLFDLYWTQYRGKYLR